MISCLINLYSPPADARSYYPCGKYDSSTEYVYTDRAAPYVKEGDEYYVIGKEGSGKVKGLDPATDYAANGSSATWILGNFWKFLFSDVLFSEFGKLGSAVFQGDFMFSQHGTLNGAGSTAYQSFNKDDPSGTVNPTSSFIPNLYMDLLNGILSCRQAVIEGSVTLKKMYYKVVEVKNTDMSSDAYAIVTDNGCTYDVSQLFYTVPSNGNWNIYLPSASANKGVCITILSGYRPIDITIAFQAIYVNASDGLCSSDGTRYDRYLLQRGVTQYISDGRRWQIINAISTNYSNNT